MSARMSSKSKLLARAPSDAAVTDYDRTHRDLYMRLFDAADVGARWQDAASEILALDPADPDTYAIWASHLARARWMVSDGWKQLIGCQP